MKKILIPTDFSKNAMNAINYGLKLFENELCKFYILHACQQELYEKVVEVEQEHFSSYKKEVKEKAHVELDNLLATLKENAITTKHLFKIISVSNILVDEVDTIVEEKNIDLVIMGTKGNTNCNKLTFGSHTLQVLKYIKCPVLAIPEGYTFKIPKRIVLSTDYFKPYQERELDFLGELASVFQSQIEVVYISETKKLSSKEERNKQIINEKLKNNRKKFIVINGENFPQEMTTYIEGNNTDILVMVNRRHSYLENLWYQDNVDKIGLSINIPLLALQNIKRE